MIRLGGLWVHKTNEGETYLSGDFGSMARIVIMKNTFKEKDTQPDYTMYVENKEKKDSQIESTEVL